MAKKLICKKQGVDDDYHSVLNAHKRWGVPYRALKNEQIKLIHDGSGHLLLTYFFKQWKDPDLL